MQTLPIYQVDAFAEQVFRGNPAAVVPLAHWLPDAVMQAIAAENNLSETAFFVATGDHYQLRWFTPTVEVDLCGHATLASASIIFETLSPQANQVSFATRSGTLRVTRAQHIGPAAYTLDFPVDVPVRAELPPALAEVLGTSALEYWVGRRNLALVDGAGVLRHLQPRFGALDWLQDRNLIVTAPAETNSGFDFVSRFFAPFSGVAEDPVTGSAHCTLAPFWAARLGKTRMRAYQASARGGALDIVLDADRVFMTGHCVRYLEGQIKVPGARAA